MSNKLETLQGLIEDRKFWIARREIMIEDFQNVFHEKYWDDEKGEYVLPENEIIRLNRFKFRLNCEVYEITKQIVDFINETKFKVPDIPVIEK